MTKEDLLRDVYFKSLVYARANGFSDDLCGLCALSSFALLKRFQDNGYKNAKVVWGVDWCGHCWLEHDGLIYDPTAEQFGELRPARGGAIFSVAEKSFYERYKRPVKRGHPLREFPMVFSNIECDLEPFNENEWCADSMPDQNNIEKLLEMSYDESILQRFEV